MSPVAINVERWKAADIVLLDIGQLAHDSWDEESFQELIEGFPEETRRDSESLIAHVEELTRKDIKAVYLKQLQGKLWKQGYSSGEITTPLYPDVLPALESWLAIPKKLAIFSSGSVEAQLNFFKYIEIPSPKTTDPETSEEEPILPTPPPKTRDLNPLFTANFDTITAGPKLESASYDKICSALTTVPEKVVFLTDNVKEAAAATVAGVYALVVDRPDNAPLAEEIFETYPVITALDQIPL
ncbi:2,3-diketo-5-methylthio-1-phosphopentane phosphatase [Lophium mytilinum]|uniref:2,3-diketo-5-methylthio-1-phosphopentane phosphatase n=1 Tax=Lophium mytilinum TaxID=390894 RepID=A0A6A6QHL4_9PEZI|nr:2,3-diketo-5-methylthio-1-phosphopentane phosphatase [Lophium mytilinum]